MAAQPGAAEDAHHGAILAVHDADPSERTGGRSGWAGDKGRAMMHERCEQDRPALAGIAPRCPRPRAQKVSTADRETMNPLPVMVFQQVMPSKRLVQARSPFTALESYSRVGAASEP